MRSRDTWSQEKVVGNDQHTQAPSQKQQQQQSIS